jgi:DNA-binding transcriptional regulator YdaS (Cro superfamily)
MTLREYLDRLEYGNAIHFALSIGISHSYLCQLASGAASISPRRAMQIERATHGMVTRKDLLPATWEEYWPEYAASMKRKQRRTEKSRGTEQH